MDFVAAAAAALSAFVVPGRFEAELRAPKRLEGLGATTFVFGRGAAVLVDLPFWTPGFVGPFADVLVLPPSLSFRLEVTTILFVAGGALPSPSRGRLVPATSADGEPPAEFLVGESSLPDLPLLCFRFVEAEALS